MSRPNYQSPEQWLLVKPTAQEIRDAPAGMRLDAWVERYIFGGVVHARFCLRSLADLATVSDGSNRYVARQMGNTMKTAYTLCGFFGAMFLWLLALAIWGVDGLSNLRGDSSRAGRPADG